MPLPILAEILAMNSLSPYPLSDEFVTSFVNDTDPLIRYVLIDNDWSDSHRCNKVKLAGTFKISNTGISFFSDGFIPKKKRPLFLYRFVFN